MSTSNDIQQPNSSQPFQSHPVPSNDQEPGLDIGELGQITVQNDDATAASGVGTTGGPFRKTWTAKYTLRSHFDSVRALCFHPVEPVLITGNQNDIHNCVKLTILSTLKSSYVSFILTQDTDD